MIFEDRHKNQFEINWKNTDVTITGFFSGMIRNIHEWIYANLGYNNKIISVRNIKTNEIFYIGQKVEFVVPMILPDMAKAIIKEFYIDSFSLKIGAVFEYGKSRNELNGIKISKSEKRDIEINKILENYGI